MSVGPVDPVLAAIVVATPDAARLDRWYRQVLGGPANLVFDEQVGLAGRAAEPGRLTLTVEVPDLAAAKARARRAGTRWADGSTAEDPDGNLLRLVGPLVRRR